MKAAVITEFNKQLQLMNVPDPKIENPTDIIIKVEASGICRSDWHAWTGDWEWMLDMIVTGKLNPRVMVSKTVSLEEAGDVLMGMTNYATMGSVVIDTF